MNSSSNIIDTTYTFKIVKQINMYVTIVTIIEGEFNPLKKISLLKSALYSNSKLANPYNRIFVKMPY